MMPTALGAVLDLMAAGGGSLGGGEALDPRIDSAADGRLGHAMVAGVGGGMPAAYPSPQVVTIYADRATITPGLQQVTLPLTSLRVTNAGPAGLRWSRRKAADATWLIETEGKDVALTFRGRWLLLAQLGSLGGWPEPI